MESAAPSVELHLDLDRPLDLALTLGPQRRGRGDPTIHIEPGRAWRATRTPQGPATLCVAGPDAGGSVLRLSAWGEGADWVAANASALTGLVDDDSTYLPGHPTLRRLRRDLPGLRLARTLAVLEAVVPSVCEQLVVGLDARRSYAALVRRLGDAAPGPLPLVLPPAPERLVAAPYWVYHQCGIEQRRAEVLRNAARHAAALEACAALPPAAAQQRMQALPGIGPWTAAEVAAVALGDSDAVSTGDYHLPNYVAWGLAGEARADDNRMLELLRPYAGHRGRVIRHLLAGGVRPPRFGPRTPRRDIRWS
ncbi:MAG: DNA-3-methyladenine glycosylase [Candidatus Dormibacteria bacterium]